MSAHDERHARILRDNRIALTNQLAIVESQAATWWAKANATRDPYAAAVAGCNEATVESIRAQISILSTAIHALEKRIQRETYS